MTTVQSGTILADAGIMERYISAIFTSAGCSKAESGRIGENLVGANLRGHDSHGIIRTPRYLGWLRDEKLLPDREISLVTDAGAMMILDGQFGFGQTVGPQAAQRGIERAASQGVSIVALRHAGHLGRIGQFAEMAAEAGQVSIHFVNAAGSVLVAPFGGTERRMSTAPVAIGVPSFDGPPIILDFATSLVAEGKVLVAAKGGKPLPRNALIGPDGAPSGDPAMLYGDADAAVTPDPRRGPGALRAMGEHKGSGLALMCELLAGALTGSGCTGPDIGRVYNGMLSIYLPVERFDADDNFAGEVKRYIEFFKSSRPAEKGSEVLAPGEPEWRMREERLKNGLPLPGDVCEALVNAGRSVGVEAPEILN